MITKKSLCNRDGIEVFAEPSLSNKEFDGSFFNFLYDIEEKHFWFVARRELIFQIIRKFISNYKNKKMLEIGCGGGNILNYLQSKGIKADGADLFFEGLDLAKRHTDTQFYQIDAKNIPFENEFDIIGMFDILEHIQDDDKVLSGLYRSLQTNGYLVITVPAFSFLWSYFDEVSHHKRRYDKTELVNRLRQHGFSIIKATYLFMFLLPVVALKRKLFFKRFSRGELENVKDLLVREELSINPILNRLFLQLARFENFLIHFCSLPFGSSILLLARKKK